jgi:hypothetical protein
MGLTVSRLLLFLEIVRGHQDRGAYDFTPGKLQAAHAAEEKLDQLPHAHFANPEVVASLRLEIDRDEAATAFEGRAQGAET